MDILIPALLICFLAESGKPALQFARDIRHANLGWLTFAVFINSVKLGAGAFAGAYLLKGQPLEPRVLLLGVCIAAAVGLRVFRAKMAGYAAQKSRKLAWIRGRGHPLGDTSQLIVFGMAAVSQTPLAALVGGIFGISVAAALPLLLGKAAGATLRPLDHASLYCLVAGAAVAALWAVA